MFATIIGLLTGLLIILVTVFLKRIDRRVYYSLTLSAIGFLYVGFTWSDAVALVVSVLQALIFFFLSYYGAKKSLFILAIGFFLHGGWDLAYGFFSTSNLIPPHYDVFCLTADFIIGAYLLWIHFRTLKLNAQEIN